MKSLVEGIKGLLLLALVVMSTLFVINQIQEKQHSGQSDPIQSTLPDSVSMIENRLDSMRLHIAVVKRNLDSEYHVKLSNQRKYYEDKIATTRALPADSTLLLFSAFTSRRRGHAGGDTD